MNSKSDFFNVKRFIIAVIVVLFLLMIFPKMTYSEYMDDSYASNSLVFSKLTQNIELMEDIIGFQDDISSSDSYLSIAINQSNNSLSLTLYYDGVEYNSTLIGSYDTIYENGYVGYVGVYEGVLIQEKSHDSSDGLGDGLPIIVDATFTDSDIFAALTIGYATELEAPTILYYGDFSENIANISNTYAIQKLDEIESNSEILATNTASVNGDCIYQGCDTIKMGSYTVGQLSVYHADELKNQGVMTTYAKLNTSCSKVKSYLKNDMGYGSYVSTVYPDTFNISICGNHDCLHAVTNSYSPQNNSTSSKISIPIYAGKVAGVQFISFDLKMSSTKVTQSAYSSDSPHQNNKLSWNIYQRNGWNSSDFDGNAATKTGMTVAATYTYEGNVTSNVTRKITFKGSIRYEYWVIIMGNYSTYHITTGTMEYTSSVKVKP